MKFYLGKIPKLYNVIWLFMCFMMLSIIDVNAQVSGTVFKDFNANGTKENSGTFNELGLSGVVVKATKPDGSVLTVTYSGGGSSTNSTGEYTVTLGTLGQIRLEFVMPDNLSFASTGPTGGTTVIFPTGATQNLAVNYPEDYCQPIPKIATICYVSNNASVSTSSATVLWEDVAEFTTGTPNTLGNFMPHADLATQAQTGSIYGLAYHKSSKSLFASAFVKVGSNLGSSGTGGIINSTLQQARLALF